MFSDLKLFVYLGSFCLSIMGTGKLQQTTLYASTKFELVNPVCNSFPFLLLVVPTNSFTPRSPTPSLVRQNN